MQNVIVDTIGGLYAAGQLSVGLRLGFNGVLLLRKPAAIHRGVCPVLGRLGRGRPSGRPFVACVVAPLSGPMMHSPTEGLKMSDWRIVTKTLTAAMPNRSVRLRTASSSASRASKSSQSRSARRERRTRVTGEQRPDVRGAGAFVCRGGPIFAPKIAPPELRDPNANRLAVGETFGTAEAPNPYL